jgi:hypothetical protein
MYKSTNGGETWFEINTGLGTPLININAIAIHPTNPNVVYIGTWIDGVFKTTNGGQSWVMKNNGLVSSDVRSLAIDPQNPSVVYAGLGQGAGVARSTDGGESWGEINNGISIECPSYLLPAGKVNMGVSLEEIPTRQIGADYYSVPWTSVRSIAIDPTNSQTIYAADYHSGVYMSPDGGNTWSVANEGLSTRAVSALAISADGKLLYAATSGEGVFRQSFFEPTIFVDSNAPGSNDGSSWRDAFNYLQDALNVALWVDEILVADGPGDRGASFRLVSGSAIKGGYAGYGAPDPNERDIELYEAILSGDIGTAGVNTDNAYHVVCSNSCDDKTILDGFTITSGFADGFRNDSGGGGMLINSSGPIVTNCIFRANYARFGGGLCNFDDSQTVLRSCLFSGNSAITSGAIDNYHSTLNLTNCTLSGNVATNVAGIYNRNASSATVTSCIIWGNQDNSGSGQAAQILGGTSAIDYSCIQGWTGALGGTGNSDSEPLFIDANGPDDISGTQDDNLRLKPLSLCINSGDPSYTVEPNETDVAGSPRLIGGCVDMGAYEADYIEVPMKLTPQAFNPGGEGNWLKLHFVLPDGYDTNDVDVNTPAKCALMDTGQMIESDYLNAFVNEEGVVEVEARLGRSAFALCLSQPAERTLTVMGLLAGTSGQDFYGTDTVKIINNTLQQIAMFASYWLAEGCGSPDWCGGVDLDQNGTVSFADFALFDGCCIEVVSD